MFEDVDTYEWYNAKSALDEIGWKTRFDKPATVCLWSVVALPVVMAVFAYLDLSLEVFVALSAAALVGVRLFAVLGAHDEMARWREVCSMVASTGCTYDEAARRVTGAA